MSEDPVPYIAATLDQTETDEGRCRTALRQIGHWIDDSEAQPDILDAKLARKILSAIKRRANEVLAAPRSNGAVIDKLEEELGKLRGQIIDYQIAARAMPSQKAKRRAGPFESLVNAKLGARAARIDSWLRGKWPG